MPKVSIDSISGLKMAGMESILMINYPPGSGEEVSIPGLQVNQRMVLGGCHCLKKLMQNWTKTMTESSQVMVWKVLELSPECQLSILEIHLLKPTHKPLFTNIGLTRTSR